MTLDLPRSRCLSVALHSGVSTFVASLIATIAVGFPMVDKFLDASGIEHSPRFSFGAALVIAVTAAVVRSLMKYGELSRRSFNRQRRKDARMTDATDREPG